MKLTRGYLQEHLMLERRDLLYGNFLPGRFVQRGAHNAIRPLAHDILDFVLLRNVERNLPGAARRRDTRHIDEDLNRTGSGELEGVIRGLAASMVQCWGVG